LAFAFTLQSFSGKTSQGYRILINMDAAFRDQNHKLHPPQISVIEYHANFTGANPICAADYTDAKSSVRAYYPAVIRLPHDRLDVTKVQVLTGNRTDDYVHDLRGRLQGSRITGSFTESFTANPNGTSTGVTCSSGKVTFSAKR
jgi:hypothetical protein